MTKNVYIVEVSDEVTLKRTAYLLMVADTEQAAESKAIVRCVKGDIAWNEEQTDCQPHEAAVCNLPEDQEFIKLLVKSQDPMALDPGDNRLHHFKDSVGITEAEIALFREAHPGVTDFGELDDEPENHKTYTVWCRQKDRKGTMWVDTIDVVEGAILGEVRDAAVGECSQEWGMGKSFIECIGIAEGDVNLMLWESE